MTMTLTEGILAVAVGVLALAVAGTLRELAFVRIELERMQRVAGRGPLSIDGPLPEAVAEVLEGRLTTSAGNTHYLVVLDASCSGCLGYARRLGDLITSTPTAARDVTAVVAGAGATVEQVLRSAGVSWIPDPQRRITDELGVARTPAAIVLDASAGTVTAIRAGRQADIVFAAMGTARQE